MLNDNKHIAYLLQENTKNLPLGHNEYIILTTPQPLEVFVVDICKTISNYKLVKLCSDGPVTRNTIALSVFLMLPKYIIIKLS